MGKKDKTKDQPRVTETPQLTHSPFAGLSAIAGAAPAGPPQAAEPAPPTQRERKRGRLVLRRETKHRGGKAVIVVAGFAELPMTYDAIEALGKELKQLLACGGSVTREREIVLQGDNAAKIAENLRGHGFQVVGLGC